MVNFKKIDPKIIGGVAFGVVILLVVIILIVKYAGGSSETEEERIEREARERREQHERNLELGRVNGGRSTVTLVTDGGTQPPDGQSAEAAEARSRERTTGYTPLASAVSSACDSSICTGGKVLKNSSARGNTVEDCCREKSCRLDFDPQSPSAIEDAQGVGLCEQNGLIYIDNLLYYESNNGSTVEECCESPFPECEGTLLDGNCNSGSSSVLCSRKYIADQTNAPTTGYLQCIVSETDSNLCNSWNESDKSDLVECRQP